MNANRKSAVSAETDEMFATIRQIGLARFVGRINSGVIPAEEGYEAVRRFVDLQKKRPFLSRMAHTVCGRTDTYDTHSTVY